MSGRADRRERVAQLRRQGLSNPEIAEREQCNRSTIWRIVRSLPPEAPPEPTEGPEPDGRLLEFDDLALGVGILRDRALAGSSVAARDLAKLSLAQINRQGCADHVSRTQAEADMLGIYQVAKHYIVGPLMRRVLLEFEHVDEGRLAAMVEDTFDDIARDLEARQTVEEEQK